MRATTGAALALLAGYALTGCGRRYFVDLKDRPDGVKLMVLVDDDGTIARNLAPIRTEAGRRVLGPRWDLELEAEERPMLVELDPGDLVHPLGPVQIEQLAVEARQAEPEASRIGSFLWTAAAFPPSTDWSSPDDDGRFRRIEGAERARLMGRYQLRRVIETEPCPPPVRALGPYLAQGGSVFRDLPARAIGTGVITGLHAPDHEALVVVGSSVMAVVRGRTPPSLQSEAGPRDVLLAEDFGELVTLRRMLPLRDGSGYVVAGGSARGGQLWRVAVSGTGLQVTGTTTVSEHLLQEITVFGHRLAAIDRLGAVFIADGLAGPWTSIDPPEPPDSLFFTEVAGSSDGRLARSTNARVDLLFGQGWTSFELTAPGLLRSPRVEALLWDRRGVLWAGAEGGDLARIEGSSLAWIDRPIPPRLRPCAGSLATLDAVRIGQKIVALVEVEGHLLVQFEQCTALLSRRLADGCPGVLARAGETTPFARFERNEGVFVSGGRLFVTGEDGLLLAGDIVPARQ